LRAGASGLYRFDAEEEKSLRLGWHSRLLTSSTLAVAAGLATNQKRPPPAMGSSDRSGAASSLAPPGLFGPRRPRLTGGS
jgi:hypothetical protein